MRRLAVALLLIASPAAAAATTDPQPPAKRPLNDAKSASQPATPAPKHPAAHAPAHPAPTIAHTHAPAPAPKPAPPAAPAAPAPPPAPTEPPKGSNTGLPLPRFASLKTDEVNLRTGPGLRYPIDWVYRRRDLPVQIEREFEVWRLIADADGVKGWVHQATLTGRRSFVVIGSEHVVRADPNDTAAAVARLKPGVVGRLRSCDANAPWCQVQVGDYRGWLKRDAFWGTFPGEAVQ